MSRSQISVSGLKVVGQVDAEYVVSLIRSVPGFPNEKILFRDFLPIFADPRGLQILIRALAESLPVNADEFDSVAGLDARGFLFGPALALQLNKGFIAIRKEGKIPPPKFSQSYKLEYGEETLEIEANAVQPGERVLVVDDLIATGGSAKAAADLIAKCGGTIAGFSFVMELVGLGGVESLGGAPVSSLTVMPA